ncbi:TPA: DEAD/DEAH box helicase [Neisseria meningitidis]|uniref:DEAD/DEAH box helicase n=1 Tax=Neisseria meningitidis TaxID=487 RepID=UPI0007668256|nr:DEAD/DEAH box helicase [Neisseria meningitidis]APY29315.1 ATP-dependent RNA helicase RhlE [Neisseria meningitidis]MBG8597404.1 DEAD/DEAH box helicase [Neisseria meningitidis]MBG8721654.1 DEAD/DEAH box helicase [Neisseria meningitidis]MBJ1826018.1 DEAD/DEAH box helicase [Neisseria meningitidis]MBJ7850431.1 DEAD/DEAH box helicase [Neisseria meningitidis]
MSIKFADLNLDKNILSAVSSEGYESPTPIQAQAIPFALEGRDIMASAQTGSGKTAAFLLPTLQRLTKRSEKPGKGPRALVLTPTRELAAQVEKNALAYAKNMRWFRTVSIVGGASFGYQTRALSKPVDLIVATPGRLMDLMQSGKVDFERLEVLILDEADRMLDMGFIDDIETIVEATPSDRQTLLFSATWDGAVGKLARKLTKDPEIIEVERVDDQGKIEEQLLYCDDMRHKNRLLDHILRDANIDQCVIFTSTKAMTEVIADELYEKGFAANCLHGDMPQGWRNRTLMDLRKGRCKILVATDVAARGIDVPTITHVINYDLPKQAEDYVHRIGRTGRAGRTGIAITFAEVNEYVKVHKIEKYINRKLPELTIEGMEPTRKRKPAGGKPKGKGGWGDRKAGGRRGDHKPGKEGFGGKTRGEGFKKESFKKDGFKKTGEGFKGKRKAGDSFAGRGERRYKDR